MASLSMLNNTTGLDMLKMQEKKNAKQNALEVKHFTDKFHIKVYGSREEQQMLNENDFIEVQLDNLPGILT